MGLTHAVADEKDDVASDGSIFNFCELGAGHEYLSGGMWAGARNWPRRRNGGASIGNIILLNPVSDEPTALSSVANPDLGGQLRSGSCLEDAVTRIVPLIYLTVLVGYRRIVRPSS